MNIQTIVMLAKPALSANELAPKVQWMKKQVDATAGRGSDQRR
jgi:hypothetical protein